MIGPRLLFDVADLDGLDAVLLDTRLTTTGKPDTSSTTPGNFRAPSTSTRTTTWPRHPGRAGVTRSQSRSGS